MRFDFNYFILNILKLLPFLRVTFSYVLIALLSGIVIGGILAKLKLCHNKVLRYFAYVYTAVFRSIPPVVLLFLVYYGLPVLLNTQEHSRLFYVNITLALLCSASISEIIRSAFNSVPKGQYEAAVSIGLSPFQAVRRIVFPQAFLYTIPNLATTVISLLKDGSLAFTIGLVDIFGKANNINNTTFSKHILEIYLGLNLIYWLVSFVLERIFKQLEKKFNNRKFHKRKLV